MDGQENSRGPTDTLLCGFDEGQTSILCVDAWAAFGFDGLGSELVLRCGFTGSMALHRTAFASHLAFDKRGNIQRTKYSLVWRLTHGRYCWYGIGDQAGRNGLMVQDRIRFS